MTQPSTPNDPNLLKLPDWFLGMVAPREQVQPPGKPPDSGAAGGSLPASV